MKDLIKKNLEEKGISQKELAEQIYVTPQAVSKWINGESQPTFDNVKQMTKIFGHEFGNQALKKGIQNKKIMKKQHRELNELDSFGKACEETELLLETSGTQNYSHAIYVLLNWFISAVIGLTYHQYIHRKDKKEPFGYDDIFYNLNNYFEECREYKTQYPNQLEYDFFLMGGDLFESSAEDRLTNHDYVSSSIDAWFKFKKAINEQRESALLDEFRVALVDIISSNSYY